MYFYFFTSNLQGGVDHMPPHPHCKSQRDNGGQHKQDLYSYLDVSNLFSATETNHITQSQANANNIVETGRVAATDGRINGSYLAMNDAINATRRLVQICLR